MENIHAQLKYTTQNAGELVNCTVHNISLNQETLNFLDMNAEPTALKYSQTRCKFLKLIWTKPKIPKTNQIPNKVENPKIDQNQTKNTNKVQKFSPL